MSLTVMMTINEDIIAATAIEKRRRRIVTIRIGTASDAGVIGTTMSVSIIITIKDFEKLLGSYPFLMGMPGRKLWDQFLGRLWDINSLDAMNEFFENLTNMLSKTKEERRKLAELGEAEEEEGVKLSKNSPFGTFVRRAQLEYQRLQFHDCTELWKNFVRYRQPTSHYLKRKIPGFPRLSFDNVLLLGEQEYWDPESTLELASVAYGDMLTGDETKTVAVSTEDIETLLEFQIEQMQSAFRTMRNEHPS